MKTMLSYKNGQWTQVEFPLRGDHYNDEQLKEAGFDPQDTFGDCGKEDDHPLGLMAGEVWMNSKDASKPSWIFIVSCGEICHPIFVDNWSDYIDLLAKLAAGASLGLFRRLDRSRPRFDW